MNTRPATKDDYAAIATLFEQADEAILGHPTTIDVSEVDGWLGSVALETNTWLFEDDGKLVAASFAQNRDGLGIFAGSVLPDAEGRGYGARIVDLAQDRLAEEGSTRLHAWTIAGNERGAEIFRSRGFVEVRRFWDMAIELDVEPPQPNAPIELFAEDDARAFHAALEEAFADHWEPHPESFESWWERQIGRSNHDPSLWFVIRDGDEIAAICRNEERESCGYVGALGVRRDWRGRGYGRALLLHTFREFRRRGQPRVTLGVDAANPTGATRLYESVGMRATREDVVWEKHIA
jgi:ribosomal protein S18 acetylase RimI-like enzyme